MIEKLILGTVQFGLDYGISNTTGKISDKEAGNILKLAEGNGIKYIDTAAAYGGSEQVIGDYLAKHPKSPLQVITKLHLKDRTGWRQSLNQSLDKLNRSRLDILLFHSYTDYLNNQDVVEELLESKGKSFGKLGVSVYTNEDLMELAGDDRIEVVQVPFNVLDNTNLRKKTLEICRKAGKQVHTRSVFLQGLFFLDMATIPEYLHPLRPYLRQLHQIAEKEQVPIGALALQYVLSTSFVDGVLIGVDSLEQFSQNLEWVDAPISQTAVAAINEIRVKESELLNPSIWKKRK